MEQLKNEQQAEKTFTQDQVNEIVQNRLAEERKRDERKTGLTELEQRAKDLDARELKIKIKEAFKDKGYPEELVEVLDIKDDASLDKCLEVVGTHFNNKKPVLKGVKPGMPADIEDVDKTTTRKAFGLK